MKTTTVDNANDLEAENDSAVTDTAVEIDPIFTDYPDIIEIEEDKENIIPDLFEEYEERESEFLARTDEEERAAGMSNLTMSLIDRVDEQIEARTVVLSDVNASAEQKQKATQDISRLMSIRSNKETQLTEWNAIAFADRSIADNGDASSVATDNGEENN